MNKRSINWKKLFLFSLGLFIASAFAMKWMENDLMYNQEKISIFGLELFYSKERIIEIFKGINEKVRTILGYHLSFDFIFMAGVYPGICALNMMAANKTQNRNFRRVLFFFGSIQIFGWAFDIIENYYLLKWLNSPAIGNEFGFYHSIVYSKWIIALSGALAGLSTILILLFKRTTLKNPS